MVSTATCTIEHLELLRIENFVDPCHDWSQMKHPSQKNFDRGKEVPSGQRYEALRLDL